MTSPFLSNHFSWFVMPFQWNGNMVDTPGWERSGLHPHDSCFFTYVQHFFTCNSESAVSVDMNGCMIYQLVNNGFEKFFRHRYHCETDSESIHFRLVPNFNDILAPHIFLFPLSSIGILTFAIRYDDAQLTTARFALFNHHLKNLSSGQSLKITPADPFSHTRALDDYMQTLVKFSGNKSEAQTDPGPWTIRLLVDFLSRPFREKYFSDRLHVFSYYQTRETQADLEFRRDLYRITRAYDFDYHPNEELLENGRTFIQPFENIYFAASIEGAAIALNIGETDAPVFLQNFKEQTVRGRYLWIYLLAFLQRSALISMTNSITRLYAGSNDPSREDLMECLSILSKIQLRTIFTEVSNYSQHNEFYGFCRQKMNTPKLAEDLAEKLKEVDRIIGQKTDAENKRKEKLLASEKEVRDAERNRKEKIYSLVLGGVFIPSMWFSILTSPYFYSLNLDKENFEGLSFFGLYPHLYLWHFVTISTLALFAYAVYMSVREFIRHFR